MEEKASVYGNLVAEVNKLFESKSVNYPSVLCFLFSSSFGDFGINGFNVFLPFIFIVYKLT